MPSHGTEIIDGIPVILKDGVMFAFQHACETGAPIRLGAYDVATKKTNWDMKDDTANWLAKYKEALLARSRK